MGPLGMISLSLDSEESTPSDKPESGDDTLEKAKNNIYNIFLETIDGQLIRFSYSVDDLMEQ